MRLHVLVGCPYCIRVMFAMQALQLKHELIVYTKTEQIKTEEYLELNPKGEAPVLETSEGVIYESSAILRYIAAQRPELGLAGRTPFEASQVEMWMLNCQRACGAIAGCYIQVIAKVPGTTESYGQSVEQVLKELPMIEEHLAVRTYLVGHQVTIADYCLVSFLTILYQWVLDEKQRVAFPNLLRYWKNIAASPVYTAFYGSHKRFLHKTLPLASPESFTTTASAGGKKAEGEKKKEEKPKDAAPKAQEKPAAQKPQEKKTEQPKKKEEAPASEPKAEAEKPTQDAPQTSFDLYSFKTMFVNEKNREAVVDFAAKNYDKDHFSFWHARYDKHTKEGKELIPTNNLLTNFVSRVSDLGFGKKLIAVHGIYGEEPDLEIQGVWFWQDKGILPEWKDHPSHEYIQWTQLDPAKPEDRARILAYWSNTKSEEGTVEGRRCRTLKIVK